MPDNKITLPKWARSNARKFTDIGWKIADWLVPQRCLNCHQMIDAYAVYCETCYAALPFQVEACYRCGQSHTNIDPLCGRCLIHPPAQDETFSPFTYETPVSDAIQRFKYAEHPELALRLARLLSDEISAAGLPYPELLLPVPAHIGRLRARGYNQSALLCRYLGRALSIPYDLSLLKKHRPTAPQATLSLKQRKRNVDNSFSLASPLNDKRVAIVDDVITTGATAHAIATLLKSNGAKTVQVWTLAHAL